MEKLTKSKVVLHSIALFVIMFLGDFIGSLPWDIIFRFITLPYNWMYGLFRTITCIGVTLLLFYQYSKRVLHSDMSFFRISVPKIKLIDVVLALLLPIIVIVSYIFIGKPSVSNNLTRDGIVSIILLALYRALKAGILEEVLFRGFILKLVESKWNKYVAIIAPSLIFSLVHIPSMQTFSSVGLLLLLGSGTLVGVMFSLMTYKNSSILSSALTHIIWNFTMISNVFYFGKEANDKAIFSITISSENPLFTGGDFGIESSIIAIIAYFIISIIILLCMKCSQQSR